MKRVMKNRLIEEDPDFEVKKLDPEEKEKILEYMKGVEFNIVSGKIFDCYTKTMLREENLGIEKDGYIWTTSHIYHFEKYDAELNDDFYKMVIGA